MKQYYVYLYRCIECRRGWLAYLTNQGPDFKMLVRIEARNGASAKNAAITAVNGMERVKD